MQLSLSGAIDLLNRVCQNELKHLNICNERYDVALCATEIGVEREFLLNLLQDYTSQLLESKTMFLQALQNLVTSKANDEDLDFTPFRNIAHKNLGVARNLCVDDAQKILQEMMKSEDLNYLMICIDTLEACTVKLLPTSK